MPWVQGKAGGWPGGRIWEREDGTHVYVIKKQIGGKRYQVFTPATGIRAALVQLERFQANPEAYDPAGDTADRLLITPELVRAFLEFSRDEKTNSRGWVLQQRAYLAWWEEKLRGRDLRKLDLARDVIPALDSAPERRHRSEVLKAFCSWLRKERHLLSRSEDATLDLAVKARRPEQWTRPKAIPRASYLRVLAALPPHHRDSMILLDETGWHVSELARFVRAGTIEDVPSGRSEAAILETRHKSGEPHRTAIGPDARAAAERLRKRAGFSVSKFYEAIQAACKTADVPAFTPGRFRHTFATRAIDEGVAPEAVSAYLGHKSPATMRRFYATLAAAPRPKR
jgi:integrase